MIRGISFTKFERKPIAITPTCAVCGKFVKDHTQEQTKSCTDERRKCHVKTSGST
ncbi:protein of unknown function [Candidatus Nitrosotalea okcheonensis]|uniref:Uncharacterized protein n=1 Tax=Candidatus Nitrosotalea okcheonensis TaxID=1903276 RepID=A0A2H1FDD3_9ARCH|nr:protein of unknown function [Candidatus Nitrosotalea okcheonensis]